VNNQVQGVEKVLEYERLYRKWFILPNYSIIYI